MRIGLLMFLLAGIGCARAQPAVLPETVSIASQEVCSTGQQRPGRGRPGAAPCSPQASWWNTVGDALNGAATAARLPRP